MRQNGVVILNIFILSNKRKLKVLLADDTLVFRAQNYIALHSHHLQNLEVKVIIKIVKFFL